MFLDPGEAFGRADIEEKVVGVVAADGFTGREHAGKDILAEIFLAKVGRKVVEDDGLEEVGARVAEIPEAGIAGFVVNLPDPGLVGEFDDVTVVWVTAGMNDEGRGGLVLPVKEGELGEVEP